MTATTLTEFIDSLSHCDTASCGNPWEYHDPTGLRRCTPCKQTGWPAALPVRKKDIPPARLYPPPGSDIPPDYTPLYAHLDKRHGPVVHAEIIHDDPDGTAVFGELDERAEQAMTVFLDATQPPDEDGGDE